MPDDAITRLVDTLGLPAVWSALVIILGILVAIIVTEYIKHAIESPFAKQLKNFEGLIDRQNQDLEARLNFQLKEQLNDQKAELDRALQDRLFLQNQYTNIIAYTGEQYAGLRTAYRRLFAGDGAAATGEDFLRIVHQAQDDVMQPIRKYGHLLDQITAKESVMVIQAILEQFANQPSPAAVESFKHRGNDFYNMIMTAERSLTPAQIFKELGLIDRLPGKEGHK